MLLVMVAKFNPSHCLLRNHKCNDKIPGWDRCLHRPSQAGMGVESAARRR